MVEVDHALELGLHFGASQRALFNALYTAKQQTSSGWMSTDAILRLGWNYDPDFAARSLVRVAVYRLRRKLKGTRYGVESADGGMYRLTEAAVTAGSGVTDAFDGED